MAKSSQISENLATGALRIFMTGFLEIAICSYIGLGIFELKEMTTIDILTAVVNICYIVCLFIFSVTAFWFILWKASPLIKFKATRDRLEHLKVLKILNDKYADSVKQE